MSTEIPLDVLQAELQRRNITLERDGTKLFAVDPYHHLSPALDAAIRRHREQLVAILPPVPAAVTSLRQAIHQTQDWQDLEKALERAQGAYERGELVAEEVEALAILAAQEARHLPEKASQYTEATDEVRIYPEGLLPN